jgi:hypothetical protein
MDRMMDIAVVVGAMCDVSLLSLWCLREDRCSSRELVYIKYPIALHSFRANYVEITVILRC